MLSKDGGMYKQIILFDNGNHNDLQPGDNIFGINIEGNNKSWTANFFVRASDHSGNVTDYPCDPVFVDIPIKSPNLVINEFCASNQSIIADNFGEYDDWIEIHNKGTASVFLGNKFLSDNLLNRDKWKMPYLYLKPGSFILIWADGQVEQGDRHTNFSFNMQAEEIGLFDSPSTGFQLIDKIVYNLQNSDHSYARAVDGEIVWKDENSPTPGRSNHIPLFVSDQVDNNAFKVYPNPVAGNMVFFNTETSVRLFDIYGKELLKAADQYFLSVGSLLPGVYIILFESGESLPLIKQ